MANAGEIRARITLENEQFRRRMAETRQDMNMMDRTSRGLTDVLKGMGVGMVGLATGVGVVVGASTKVAMDFEAAMKSVEAKSGASAAEMEQLAATAKEMGATTKFSATESAQALDMLAMSGMDATQMMEALPQVLALASAGGLDLATSADIATNVMSGFKLEAQDLSRVTDVLAKTATSSNSTVQSLGESMKMVAPVAASLGIPIEEVAAALGVLHNNGIKGSEAGTALRGSLAQLLNPSKENAKAMKELGISLTDAEGNMKSLPVLIGDIDEALEGMSDTQKTATIASIVGTEAVSGFMALLSEGESGLKSYTSELENAAGSAQQMADTMNDSTKGATKELMSAVEGLALKIGEKLNPAYRGTVEALTEYIQSISGAKQVSLDSIEADIKKTDSLLKQVDATEDLIFQFDQLVSKAGLSSEQFGKLIDIVEEMNSTTDTTRLEELNGKMDALSTMSGLSNDELLKMVDLNNRLIEILPSSNQQISEQGNIFNDNVENLRNLNDEQREQLRLQLEVNLAQAEANYSDNLQKQKDLIYEMNLLKNDAITLDGLIRDKENEIKGIEQERQQALENHNDELAKILGLKLSKHQEYLDGLLDEKVKTLENIQKKQESVDLTKEELAKVGEIKHQLALLTMSQVGLNAEKGKEVETVQQAIDKVNTEINQIHEAAAAQGGLNNAQRDRLRDLDNEKGKLSTILGTVQDITQEAGKDVNKDITFTGDGESTANSLHNNLSRPAYKSVKVTQTVSRVFDSSGRPVGTRHSGGTLRDLPKFHSGGSPGLLSRPLANEVDVRLLRNEMVLTEGQQANLFKMLDSYIPAKRENIDYDRLSGLVSGGNTYITVEGNIDSDLYNDIMRKQTNETNVKLRAKGIKRR